MRFLTALVLAICLASLACQQYSTTMQQSVTKLDETPVLGALRAIAVAETAYSLATGGQYGTLDQLVEGGYLDQRFRENQIKDYVLSLKVGPDGFSCNADPVAGKTGRHFYIDSTSNQIHVNATEPATARDETVQ